VKTGEFAMIKIIKRQNLICTASQFNFTTFINTLFKTINMKKIYVAAITAILLLTFNGVNAQFGNGNGYGNGYGNGRMNQMSQMNQIKPF
jgi:hypothetical protein